MTSEKKSRFTVINNENFDRNIETSERRTYRFQTNPLNIQGQSLREQFMRFANEEAGPKFTVEDLLKW